MKNLFKKLAAILAAGAMTLSFTACDQFINELNSAIEDIAVMIEQTMAGVDYIIDNFEDFKNPIEGTGTPVDEWVGTELEPLFVRPEGEAFVFDKGYWEENTHGKVFANLGAIASMAEVDAYIQMLRADGYDEYHEKITWGFYNGFLIANQSKLCMALKKGDVYVQIAYFATEGAAVNAVFAIADYDMLAVIEDEISGEGDPTTPEEGAPATPEEGEEGGEPTQPEAGGEGEAAE